jgi:muconolactone delta-isomerase
MDNQKNLTQYMVEFELPEEFTYKMVETIPQQRKQVDTYFQMGVLLAYTLAADRSKLWAIFNVESEEKLEILIRRLPMTKYFKYKYLNIMFHSTSATFPVFSLN